MRVQSLPLVDQIDPKLASGPESYPLNGPWSEVRATLAASKTDRRPEGH